MEIGSPAVATLLLEAAPPAGAEAPRPARRHGCRAAACALALAALAAAASAAPATPSAVRTNVVPVTAAELHDVVRAAAGRVVLVNVWATWCEPCRQEFPDLLRLRRALAGRGFELVLVSADFDSRLPAVRSFLAGQGVDFTTYLKNQSDTPFIDGLDPAWSGSLPATFVYDRSGALREFWEGRATYRKLLSVVDKLLGP